MAKNIMIYLKILSRKKSSSILFQRTPTELNEKISEETTSLHKDLFDITFKLVDHINLIKSKKYNTHPA